MEEDILKKKEENLNSNINNNQNKKSSKKIVIGLIIVILMILGGFAVYKFLIEKSNKPQEVENTEQNELNNVELLNDEFNMSIKFNGKTSKLRYADDTLYVDDKEIASVDCSVVGAYVADKYVLLKCSSQTYFYPYAIDTNYKLIDVDGNPDTPTCSIHDVVKKNGKLTATETCYDDYDGDDDYDTKVEFEYDGKKVTIKEIKDNNTNEKNETNDTTSSTNEETKINLTANTTYKSIDGKSSLTVDSLERKEEGDYVWGESRISYNGKKYTFRIYKDDYKYNQYLTITGDPDSGISGQCSQSAVVLNLKNKTIERFSTTGMYYFDVLKGEDGYFFTEGYCLSGYDITVYDNNWKKLGRLVEQEKQGNVYVLDNGKIIKFNSNGSKISETTTSAKYTGPGVIYNNTLYYIGDESSGVYLYNNDTNEKYKLRDQNGSFKDGYDPYHGLDIDVYINLSIESDKIMIKYETEEYEYSFDIKNKQLTKIN